MVDRIPSEAGVDENAPDTVEPAPFEPVPHVGYKHPPAEHRFVKGKSGNKKGRPRGSRSFKSELREVVELRIPVSENGRKSHMSVRQAMLVRLRQQGLAGDARAIDRLLKLCLTHLPDEPENQGGHDSKTDEALFAEIMADLRGAAPAGGDDDI